MARTTHPQTATWNREDRDLLIELRTEMKSARDDISAARDEIKEINTGISGRLLNLETNAVSRVELDEIRSDIESLQLWRSALLGAYGLALILIPMAFAYFT